MIEERAGNYKCEGQEQARLEELGVLAKWRPSLETGTLGAVIGRTGSWERGPHGRAWHTLCVGCASQ